MAAIALLAVIWLCMASCRGSPVYYPAPYDASTWDHLPPRLQVLRYRIDQGEQVSFYARPASAGEPRRLWLLFNGQGDTALEWCDLLQHVGDPDAGFLLFDYPGSGFCSGSSTPSRILAASEAAVEALRNSLGLSEMAMEERVGVFGYSLGTAAALQYAARHEVRRVVVAAPFTTLAEMADRMYAWPSGEIIRDRFDNGARLAEIARQARRPPVLFIHGDQDDTIPVEMSARLAAPYPGWIERIVVAGADHDTVVVPALRTLAER